jgi:hypothetical protein
LVRAKPDRQFLSRVVNEVCVITLPKLLGNVIVPLSELGEPVGGGASEPAMGNSITSNRRSAQTRPSKMDAAAVGLILGVWKTERRMRITFGLDAGCHRRTEAEPVSGTSAKEFRTIPTVAENSKRSPSRG